MDQYSHIMESLACAQPNMLSTEDVIILNMCMDLSCQCILGVVLHSTLSALQLLSLGQN